MTVLLRYNRRFRVGVFDAVAARYAIEACGGADCLAITHIDRLPQLPRKLCVACEVASSELVQTAPSSDAPRTTRVTRLSTAADPKELTELCRQARSLYEQVEGFAADSMLARIEEEARVPIGIQSFGPSAEAKRTSWPGL